MLNILLNDVFQFNFNNDLDKKAKIVSDKSVERMPKSFETLWDQTSLTENEAIALSVELHNCAVMQIF